jgi:hypothetical protein
MRRDQNRQKASCFSDFGARKSQYLGTLARWKCVFQGLFRLWRPATPGCAKVDWDAWEAWNAPSAITVIGINRNLRDGRTHGSHRDREARGFAQEQSVS